ncbi:hypothetical protein SmJEL517_g06044 [Synchytrium microbalum]|uniref:3-oxoacyl-[acyl-carrier-protein] reductase n=1 Tax=Synchytrium microbalum TaxID=1806994 RepID=A0A507BX80_9FUNG|nr:uncharacterized protein SmJEL517_g06044 [Synchytrium microbalum]TPX30394.1 hypothetical protein SmJEL517_g06044 [Synchytrium microbalum]
MAARISAIRAHLQDETVEKVVSSPNQTSLYPKGLLYNEVAIITGSGQGIGAATAKAFAAEGAKVVITDIDASKSDAVAKEIGANAISVPGDITAKGFAEKLVGETVKAFGKINHIVNNAGFTYDGMAHKTTDRQWEIMMDIHVTAPFRIIRAAADQFRTKSTENRSIVMVSSTSGLHGNLGQLNYATAKAGVVGLTKTMAKEWGSFGVRTNCIAFGWVETRLTAAKELAVIVDGQKIALGIPQGNATPEQMQAARTQGIPLQRPGTAEEAGKAILFLASPLASYITGHTLEMTGGRGI